MSPKKRNDAGAAGAAAAPPAKKVKEEPVPAPQAAPVASGQQLEYFEKVRFLWKLIILCIDGIRQRCVSS